MAVGREIKVSKVLRCLIPLSPNAQNFSQLSHCHRDVSLWGIQLRTTDSRSSTGASIPNRRRGGAAKAIGVEAPDAEGEKNDRHLLITKYGNGKTLLNGDFNRNITDKWTVFHCHV